MNNIPVPSFFVEALENAYQPIAEIYREILQAQIAYNQQVEDDSRKCKSSITKQLLSDRTLPEAEKEKMEELLHAAGHINALQGGIMAPYIDSVTNFLFQKWQLGTPITTSAINDNQNAAMAADSIISQPNGMPLQYKIASAEAFCLFSNFFQKINEALVANYQQFHATPPDYFYLQSKTSELIRQYLAESKEPVMQAVAIG